MQTFEGRKIDQNSPLSEYPTPQFRRDSYFSLNGIWELQILADDGSTSYDGEIVVPFAVETLASNVKRRIKPTDKLVYNKKFVLPEGLTGQRVLLHFEAVDQVADVYLNDIHIYHHEGGYLPFTVDCLEAKKGENHIRVEVSDDTTSEIYPRGKQAENPKTIWYTPTSGIWGSVWLEGVPNQVIQSLNIVPLFDEKAVEIGVKFEGKPISSKVEVAFNGKMVASGSLNEDNKVVLLLSIVKPWTPETPDLYDIKVSVNSDTVHSYFGLRKFSKVNVNGHEVFALNNKPLFLTGVLDQGYFPESGLTPPTDKAMVDDILAMKSLGFNMLRKHIKIEPMRWYYHCDRLGMIVIQDFVNGGAKYNDFLIAFAPIIPFKFDDTKSMKRLGRKNQAGRDFFEKEMEGTVERLKNCPCIAIWTLFNEGWGQFESVRLTKKLRELDSTRLIDSTSGWFDQGAGDFSSHHVYFIKIRLKPAQGRILSLTEFGGYSLRIEEHTESKKNFSYGRVKNQKELENKLTKLYRKQVIPLKEKGLSVAVLTQLCDVEGETNGLLTYDRKITKVRQKVMLAINEELKK